MSRPSAFVYRGRFAPSPSGPLHFGSLIAALGSFLDARSQGGSWIVRIEDIDTPRTVSGAADDILRTLKAFGLDWDGEVAFQSKRLGLYQDALELLIANKLVYPCTCTRKILAESATIGPCGRIYPGTCRNKSIESNPNAALRLLTNGEPIAFTDRFQGKQKQELASESGDFVVKRADGLFAYQLVVVVDDADQNINQIVRGSDLLPVTPRQIYLQSCLGLPAIEYGHLPLAVLSSGYKLSKQNHAAELNRHPPGPELSAALNFLGQNPPAELADRSATAILDWAIANWEPEKVPRVAQIKVAEAIK